MSAIESLGFHNKGIDSGVELGGILQLTIGYQYKFEPFFHPFIGQIVQQLNKSSVAQLLQPPFLENLFNSYKQYYEAVSGSNGQQTIEVDIPGVNSQPNFTLDTSIGGPYSIYNWELFYHIPITIAVHLSNNQRFTEAQDWFHLIFDPTFTDEGSNPSFPYWKFAGFRQSGIIDDVITILNYSGSDPTLQGQRDSLINGYSQIVNNPFDPFAVAEVRPAAFQYYVVMRYLDNLINWGDSLFQQYTIETINEATLCYVLAANLLGPQPQQIPPRGTAAPMSYSQLQKAGMDAMGDALEELEVQFPFDLMPSQQSSPDPSDASSSLFGVCQSLYFCFPPNQTLLQYWQTVSDRLTKIRNCEDITGVVRPLPLFDPPIDPGMLVQAAAAGLDIGSVVSGLSQPIGPVRGRVMVQKAMELANEVKSLGAGLLSALEKGDSEGLALLRQTNEVAIQQMTENVKFLQWKQTQEATQCLMRTRSTTWQRYSYYLRLLGQTPDPTAAPETFPITSSELTEGNFSDVYSALVSQYDQTLTIQSYSPLVLAGTSSPSAQSGGSGTGQLYLNSNEDADLNQLLPQARDERLAASVLNTVASTLVMIPDFDVDLHFWGMGASSEVFGGVKLSKLSGIGAEVLQMKAAWDEAQAGMASKTASYQRRADEWTYQANLAARELMQIGRQIIQSLISEQVAYHEYTTAQTQLQQAQKVQNYLQTKFTNQQLYLWMQGQLSGLYYQYYRLAFQTAQQAEQTVKQELMRPELDQNTFIQYNYWDTGHQGLLSGDALCYDIRRLEMAYLANNKREFELTKHVSLRQLDPVALLDLKVTGSCTITVPEWLFDRDCPGHYMRRIKSVAVSIPSVVGPYTNVNCTLTIQQSTVRVSSNLAPDGGYAREGQDDSRFVDYFGSIDSIVTSAGSSDSGMFETNLNDERFLPFEGAGACSTWSLSLPTTVKPPLLRPFDYMTISDVILHIRYTARQGGAQIAQRATLELQQAFEQNASSLEPVQLSLLFSLRYDFPTAWSAFVNGTADYAFTLQKEFFPYLVQDSSITFDGFVLYSQGKNQLESATPDAINQKASLTSLTSSLNGATGACSITLPVDPTVLVRSSTAQIFLVIQYHIAT